MKSHTELEKIYTDLAERLVTPERYGNVALAQVIEFPQPTLFELPDESA